MRKIHLILLMSYSMVSCKQLTLMSTGHYEIKMDYRYIGIDFFPDSTFKYIQQDYEIEKTCSGIWNQIDERKVSLECKKDSINLAYLTLAGNTQEVLYPEVFIISKKRLKFGNMILRRKN